MNSQDEIPSWLQQAGAPELVKKSGTWVGEGLIKTPLGGPPHLGKLFRPEKSERCSST
jgi:hypothetical protein